MFSYSSSIRRIIGWTCSLLCWIPFLAHLQLITLPFSVTFFHSRNANTKTPIHLHLALTADPSQVLIQFTTTDEGIPVAVYGFKDDFKGDAKATGTSTTYSSSDLCDSTKTSHHSPTIGYFHTIVLSNLQADTRYHYQVGIAVGQGIVWSETVYYFMTPPIDETSYSFLVLANQGTLQGVDSVHAIAQELDVEVLRAIHHLGGLSYARGNATIWDDWFRMIQVYAAKVPLMIVVGNTEYDYLNGTGDPSGVNASYTPIWGNYANNDSGGECGVVVSKRFQMPSGGTGGTGGTSGTGGNGVFWYRHEAPLVTTIVLSSEHDMSPLSSQYQWLQQELDRTQTTTKWIVLEIHRPLYMNQARWEDNNVGLGLRRSIEPLLRNKVDLVLSGHYNAYFRSCPGLFQSRCQNGGPTHITVGSAGVAPDQTEWYPASWSTKTMGGQRGYGRVTVHNRSVLEFQWIGLDFNSDDGNVLDQYWIYK